jgi:hypothetical protein
MNDRAFSVLVRRGDGADGGFSVRFRVDEGLAKVVLPVGDHPEPPFTSFDEIHGVPLDHLRSGRFVREQHHERQSFSLAHIHPDAAQRLPTDAWTTLEPVLSQGFRYLVLPSGVDQERSTPPTTASAPAGPVDPLDGLRHRIGELEAQLAASHQRERELAELLARWHARDAG